MFSRIGDGAKFILEVLRARPVARRLLSGVSVLLAVIGVGMLAYPFATNVWAERLQRQLAKEFVKPETKIAYQEGTLGTGDPLTRISIPAIGLDPRLVVEGTTESALRAGAGHYKNTPLPGEEGNVAIAGHRTTFSKPFANIDNLEAGDDIILETPVGTYVYKVMSAEAVGRSANPYVVQNNDWSPIAQSAGKTLTLTSCHPKGSSRERIIVKAELAPTAA